MAAQAADDPMGSMQEMLRSIIETITNLGAQVNVIDNRVLGVGNLDAMRIELHELDLKVSQFRQDSPSRAPQSLSLINPKDIKVREFDGEGKGFSDFVEDSKAYF